MPAGSRALRRASLSLIAVGLLTALTASTAGATPLADEWTAAPPPPALASVLAAVQPPARAHSSPVEELLEVFGWSVDGLQTSIAARLTLPPLSAPAAAWAPPPRLVEGAPPPPPSTASAVVVMDEASMALLAQRDPNRRLAPASLTKVATAALAVQTGRLDETVHNNVESWAMPGSSLMGLHPGDQFSLRDLVYGLMLPSGNDAALSIGRHLAGDDELFVYYMNRMVDHLGLADTHFTDPHGLGGPDHYSSAVDLALLSRYAMQSVDFRHVVGAMDWTAHGSRAIAMSSYVGPFMSWVEGADGLKTGYTRQAGPTFIGSATRNGHRLYVVILNSQDRFGEAAAMLDWAFENHVWSGAQAVSATPAEDDAVVQAAQLKE